MLPPILPHFAFAGKYSGKTCTAASALGMVTQLAQQAESVWKRSTGSPGWGSLVDFDQMSPLRTVTYAQYVAWRAGREKLYSRGALDVYTPFCAQMSKGWGADELVRRITLPPMQSADVLHFGRIYSGEGQGRQGLDLEIVRPACDLKRPPLAPSNSSGLLVRPDAASFRSTHCRELVALAPWKLTTSLQRATIALLAARGIQMGPPQNRRPFHCVHVRSGRGETKSPAGFVRSAVTQPLQYFRARQHQNTSPPLFYLAADVSWGTLMKEFAPQVKELRDMCGEGRCVHSTTFFTSDQRAAWARDSKLGIMRSDIETMILDLTVCTQADQFWQGTSRSSSFAKFVTALRAQGPRRSCSVEDVAPGPRSMPPPASHAATARPATARPANALTPTTLSATTRSATNRLSASHATKAVRGFAMHTGMPA